MTETKPTAMYLVADGAADLATDILTGRAACAYGRDSIYILADSPAQAVALGAEYDASDEPADSPRWAPAALTEALADLVRAQASREGRSIASVVLDAYDVERPTLLSSVADDGLAPRLAHWHSSTDEIEQHHEIRGARQDALVYADGSAIVLCEGGAWSLIDRTHGRRAEQAIDTCDWLGMVRQPVVLDEGDYPHPVSALDAAGISYPD